jgi:hypothetical protein
MYDAGDVGSPTEALVKEAAKEYALEVSQCMMGVVLCWPTDLFVKLIGSAFQCKFALCGLGMHLTQALDLTLCTLQWYLIRCSSRQCSSLSAWPHTPKLTDTTPHTSDTTTSR